jgi:hypothetical protein
MDYNISNTVDSPYFFPGVDVSVSEHYEILGLDERAHEFKGEGWVRFTQGIHLCSISARNPFEAHVKDILFHQECYHTIQNHKILFGDGQTD